MDRARALKAKREVHARWKAGLSTFPQIATLAGLKIDAKPMYIYQASAVIGHIAQTAKIAGIRWKRPSDFEIDRIVNSAKKG